MSIVTKILLGLCLLTALALGSIWIITGKPGKHSTQITINAHRADVFDWLVESERIRQWDTNIVEVASIESEDQPESQRIVKVKDADVEYTDQVLRFDHGTMVSVRSTGRAIVETQVFQLEGNSLGGTDLQFRLTRKPKGIGRFLVSFRDDEVEKGMKRRMRKLKKLIEKNENGQPMETDSGESMSQEGSAKVSTVESSSGSLTVERKTAPNESEREANRKRDFRSLFGTG